MDNFAPKAKAAAPKMEQKAKAAAAPKVEPKAKAAAAPKVEQKAKAAAAPKMEQKAKAAAAPKVEPKAKAAAAPKVEPKAKAAAAPKVEPKAKAAAAPKVEPKAKAAAAPKVEAKAAVTPKVEPKAKNKPLASGVDSVRLIPVGRELAELVAAAAAEHKPIEPVLLELASLSSVADWYFIASAENPRQMAAIAEKIIRRAKEKGVRLLGHEGLNRGGGHWVLVDLGDVIVHIFNLEARAVYDLEGLWTDAPRRSGKI